jgi:hypothetical protein
LGEAHELDPIDLVPYDAQPFAGLPRDRFCLVVRPSIRAVGQLLDTWHGVHFDQALNTLYLAVYRPASSPYPDDSVFKQHTESVCNVEERWVAVELSS